MGLSRHRLKSVLTTNCAAIAYVQAPEQRCTLDQLLVRWVEALMLRARVRLRRFERLSSATVNDLLNTAAQSIVIPTILKTQAHVFWSNR
jgi:hypothetical protein